MSCIFDDSILTATIGKGFIPKVKEPYF